ncbi:hypothetical protein N7495_000554 [Penicillium taxi]|uniref:uncharacterized protein n=1 Tax=Penicillium taxi TaxID=168475 RepID=UPI0025456A50|nr:uncharacterized protein N7495_000554 [Penicillium taxi]KAJ5907872.1 hypothetical protein N7495_000554 [Penicillium taxi]
MSQNTPPNPKGLGRVKGSVNAPIAAFTMALVLLSYCVSSIHSARRDRLSNASRLAMNHTSHPDRKTSSWVRDALDESKAEQWEKAGK